MTIKRKLGSAWRWIEIQFTRHELWAITWGMKLPLIAIHIWGTTWIWFIAPLVSLSLISLPLVMYVNDILAIGSELWALLSLLLLFPAIVIGFAAYIVLAVWFFGWYFTCVGLFFGKRGMAEKKKAELIIRLDSLKNPSS